MCVPTFAVKSKTGVLDTTGDTVEIKDLDDTFPMEQLWIKGMDNDGYVTFKSSESQEFLTADANTGLQIRGK